MLRSTSAFIVSLLLAGQAWAGSEAPAVTASTPHKDNVVSVSPFGLYQGTIALEYERAIDRQLSLYAGPIVPYRTNFMTPSSSVRPLKLGLVAGARYFPLWNDY